MRLKTSLNRLIEICFYLLFALVPLIMTPFNYELFEFNKMMLVYLLTAIIVTAWLVKMVLQRKIIFRRTFMDLPLVLFLLSQALATTLSIDQYTSWWGYYSRFHGGLLSTLSYLLLYWALVSNAAEIDTPRRRLFPFLKGPLALSGFGSNCLFWLLGSAGLVSAYGLAQHEGIDARFWVQNVRRRVFSTLGQPNWLAAWLVALFPLPLALWTSKKSRLAGLIGLLLMTLFYLCLLYTRSRSGLLGFVAAYLIFWLWRWQSKKEVDNNRWPAFSFLTVFLLSLTLLVGTPWTRNLNQIWQGEPPTVEEPSSFPTGGTESGEIRKIVWRGAVEIWRHYPLLGTGPETFAYSYYWHRPREHNDVSEWDFLYNKAHNEYLNFAATSGTIGLLAYLGVAGAFLIWSFRRPKALAFLAGYVSILITNFFGFSVVAVGLLFWLYPALALIIIKPAKAKREKVAELNWTQKAIITSLTLISLFFGLRLAQFWYADVLFARGEKLNQIKEYETAFALLQRAIIWRPDEPFYHDQLALAAAHLAAAKYDQGETDAAAELAQTAIDESSQALAISPYHLNFWKNRTRVFYSLTAINVHARQQPLESLLTAQQLAPTDAKVAYNLGLIYAQLDQPQAAITTLEKTIELKPNYDHARYALALLYEQKGQRKAAREQLEYILEKINPDYQPAIDKLKRL